MRVNQVLIIPHYSSKKGQGAMVGRYSEAEAIDGYIESILEHLEEDRVTVKLFNDLDPITPNTLVMYCGIGWDKPGSKAKCNLSTIESVGQAGAPLANLLCEALIDWGKSYVDFHHKTGNPRTTESPMHDGCITMVIKPFKLNGPNADDYMRSLDRLGKTIAYSVYEFLVMRNETPNVMKVDR